MKRLVPALLLFATPAFAAHAVALDAQRYAIDGGRSVRAATGVLVLAGAGGDASFALSRLGDSFDGAGWAFGAGFGARLSPVATLRGGVTRIARDQALDAWTARLGPELHAGMATLSLSALAGRREDGAWTKGASLELEQPAGPRVVARVSGSYARTDGEQDAAAGAVGARWNVAGPLSLTGEVGVARDPAGALSSPTGGLLPAPSPTSNSAARFTSRIGMRIVLP